MVKRLTRIDERRRRAVLQMRDRTAVVTLFALALAAALAIIPALAQGTAPANGCLQGSASDWLLYAGEWNSGGYGSCGAIRYPVWGSDARGFMSRPFYANSGSTITFWAKMSSWGGFDLKLIDWDNGTSTLLTWLQPAASYTQYSYSVAGTGQKKSIWIVATGGDTTTTGYFSDFQVSNSSVPGANLPGYLNGDFGGAKKNWLATYGNVGELGTVGHTTPPAREMSSGTSWMNLGSLPFVTTSSDQLAWSIWLSGTASTFGMYAYNLSNNTWSAVLSEAVSCASWCQRSVTLPNGFLSVPGMWVLHGSQGANLWIDDLCPSTGCLGYENPTPTLTPSATATGGGGGAYPTIDWSQFPTQVPYPTFPPFPTQVPFPTSIYEPGTPVPITGSVSISGTVKIDDRTPVRVKVDDSTPVAVKVDDRTPVRVMFGNGPNYTPVPWQNSGGEQRAPAAGAVLPTLITSPSQSTIQYGQAGSSANPLNFHLQQVDYYFANVGVEPLGLSFNLLIHYYYPDAFSLAGIDILPGLYGLAAVYVLVVVIRQLQAR